MSAEIVPSLSCDPGDVRCQREPSTRHRLPTTCVQDPILDTPHWKHEHSVPCTFYRVIAEWAERIPVEGGFWITPCVPPMGFAAPPARCALSGLAGASWTLVLEDVESSTAGEVIELHVRWRRSIFVTADDQQLHEEHVPNVEGKGVLFAYSVGDDVPDHEGAADEMRAWLYAIGAASVEIRREGERS
jgi:hypothetical protein